MRIIDAHAHIFPEKIAEKAVRAIGDFYDTTMHQNGLIASLLESGAEIGVERYLVFSSATKKEQVEGINQFIIDTCKAYPEFIGLGTMNPDYEQFEEELDRIKKAGIRGIKVHPDFQRFRIDDERMDPIFSVMEENGQFLMTHSGDPRHSYSNPDRVATVAKRHPRLKVIAAHFGGWMELDAAMRCLNLPNVYFDTSSTIPFTPKEQVQKALNTYDHTHIFFGTDFPMFGHRESFESVLGLGLSDQKLEDIFYNNFAEFYGL